MGVRLSRGAARPFPHNNVSALEAMLKKQVAADARKPRKARARLFLLAEGLYANGGGIAPLPELLRLRDTYGCYLIVDETLSLGTHRLEQTALCNDDESPIGP